MKKINFKPATTATKNAKEAEENRLKDYSHKQEMQDLQRVYSLPPDYRYSAAKDFGLLKWYKHKHNGLSYSNGLWENEELRKEFIEEFRRIAYRKTDFGRKQNTHLGSRTLFCPESFRTTRHLAGKWMTNEYWANFSVFFNRKKPEILFSYDNQVFIIDIVETPMALTKYIHVADAEIFKNSPLVWDAKEMAFSLEDEVYHIMEYDVYQEKGKVQEFFDRVFNALSNRVESKKKRKYSEDFFNNLSNDLVISVQHSILAGNCPVGTEIFRKRYGLMEKEEYTVSELKEKKVDFSNEMFRRAIIKAVNS